jgi:hypothetical protein
MTSPLTLRRVGDLTTRLSAHAPRGESSAADTLGRRVEGCGGTASVSGTPRGLRLKQQARKQLACVTKNVTLAIRNHVEQSQMTETKGMYTSCASRLTGAGSLVDPLGIWVSPRPKSPGDADRLTTRGRSCSLTVRFGAPFPTSALGRTRSNRRRAQFDPKRALPLRSSGPSPGVACVTVQDASLGALSPAYCALRTVRSTEYAVPIARALGAECKERRRRTRQ